jgi:hypothetical protein
MTPSSRGNGNGPTSHSWVVARRCRGLFSLTGGVGSGLLGFLGQVDDAEGGLTPSGGVRRRGLSSADRRPLVQTGAVFC